MNGDWLNSQKANLEVISSYPREGKSNTRPVIPFGLSLVPFAPVGAAGGLPHGCNGPLFFESHFDCSLPRYFYGFSVPAVGIVLPLASTRFPWLPAQKNPVAGQTLLSPCTLYQCTYHNVNASLSTRIYVGMCVACTFLFVFKDPVFLQLFNMHL